MLIHAFFSVDWLNLKPVGCSMCQSKEVRRRQIKTNPKSNKEPNLKFAKQCLQRTFGDELSNDKTLRFWLEE